MGLTNNHYKKYLKNLLFEELDLIYYCKGDTASKKIKPGEIKLEEAK